MLLRAHLLVLIGFIVSILLAQISLAVVTGSEPVIIVAKNSLSPLNENQSGSSVLVILGMADSLHEEVHDAIEEQLIDQNVIYIEIEEMQDPSFQLPGVDRVIATGAAGCQQAVDLQLTMPIVCSLLTAERFREIIRKASVSERDELVAIVIDQPLYRQVGIARKVYPALTRFAAMTQLEKSSLQADNGDVQISMFRPGVALASQVEEVTTSADALIATPESTIYNRSTLHTVLLTAYGYGKPVVGYSRAYVEAGALITGYSTPSQIFRQIAEIYAEPAEIVSNASRIMSPKYFSVVDNPDAARLSNLFKLFDFSPTMTYQDKDFQS